MRQQTQHTAFPGSGDAHPQSTAGTSLWEAEKTLNFSVLFSPPARLACLWVFLARPRAGVTCSSCGQESSSQFCWLGELDEFGDELKHLSALPKPELQQS